MDINNINIDSIIKDMDLTKQDNALDSAQSVTSMLINKNEQLQQTQQPQQSDNQIAYTQTQTNQNTTNEDEQSQNGLTFEDPDYSLIDTNNSQIQTNQNADMNKTNKNEQLQQTQQADNQTTVEEAIIEDEDNDIELTPEEAIIKDEYDLTLEKMLSNTFGLQITHLWHMVNDDIISKIIKNEQEKALLMSLYNQYKDKTTTNFECVKTNLKTQEEITKINDEIKTEREKLNPTIKELEDETKKARLKAKEQVEKETNKKITTLIQGLSQTSTDNATKEALTKLQNVIAEITKKAENKKEVDLSALKEEIIVLFTKQKLMNQATGEEIDKIFKEIENDEILKNYKQKYQELKTTKRHLKILKHGYCNKSGLNFLDVMPVEGLTLEHKESIFDKIIDLSNCPNTDKIKEYLKGKTQQPPKGKALKLINNLRPILHTTTEDKKNKVILEILDGYDYFKTDSPKKLHDKITKLIENATEITPQDFKEKRLANIEIPKSQFANSTRDRILRYFFRDENETINFENFKRKISDIAETKDFIAQNRTDTEIDKLKYLDAQGDYTALSSIVKKKMENKIFQEQQTGEFTLSLQRNKLKDMLHYRNKLAPATIQLSNCFNSKQAILQQNQSLNGGKVSAYEAHQLEECFNKDLELAKQALEKARRDPQELLKNNVLLCPFAVFIILAYSFKEHVNNRIVQHYQRLKWWEAGLYEAFAKATPEERAQMIKNLETSLKGATDETYANLESFKKEILKEKEDLLNTVVQLKTNGEYSTIEEAMKEDYLKQNATEDELIKAKTKSPVNKWLDGLEINQEEEALIFKANEQAREGIFQSLHDNLFNEDKKILLTNEQKEQFSNNFNREFVNLQDTIDLLLKDNTINLNQLNNILDKIKLDENIKNKILDEIKPRQITTIDPEQLKDILNKIDDKILLAKIENSEQFKYILNNINDKTLFAEIKDLDQLKDILNNIDNKTLFAEIKDSKQFKDILNEIDDKTWLAKIKTGILNQTDNFINLRQNTRINLEQLKDTFNQSGVKKGALDQNLKEFIEQYIHTDNLSADVQADIKPRLQIIAECLSAYNEYPNYNEDLNRKNELDNILIDTQKEENEIRKHIDDAKLQIKLLTPTIAHYQNEINNQTNMSEQELNSLKEKLKNAETTIAGLNNIIEKNNEKLNNMLGDKAVATMQKQEYEELNQKLYNHDKKLKDLVPQLLWAINGNTQKENEQSIYKELDEKINKCNEALKNSEPDKDTLIKLKQELQDLQNLKAKAINLESKIFLNNDYTFADLQKEIRNLQKEYADKGLDEKSLADKMVAILESTRSNATTHGDRIAVETTDVLFTTLQGQLLRDFSKKQFEHNIDMLKQLAIENIHDIEFNTFLKQSGSINKIMADFSFELNRIEDLEERQKLESKIRTNLEHYRNGLLNKTPKLDFDEFYTDMSLLRHPAWKTHLTGTSEELRGLLSLQNNATTKEKTYQELARQLESLRQASDNTEEYNRIKQAIHADSYQPTSLNERGENSLKKNFYGDEGKSICNKLARIELEEQTNQRAQEVLRDLASDFKAIAEKTYETNADRELVIKGAFYKLQENIFLAQSIHADYREYFARFKGIKITSNAEELLKLSDNLNQAAQDLNKEKNKATKIKALTQDLEARNTKDDNKKVETIIETYRKKLVKITEHKEQKDNIPQDQKIRNFDKECWQAYQECADELQQIIERNNNIAAIHAMQEIKKIMNEANIFDKYFNPIVKNQTIEYNTELVLKKTNLPQDTEKESKDYQKIKTILNEFHKGVLDKEPKMNFLELQNTLIKVKIDAKTIDKILHSIDELRLTERLQVNYICNEYNSLSNARKSIEAVNFYYSDIKAKKNETTLYKNIYNAIKNGSADKLSLLSEVMPLDFNRITIGTEIRKKIFDNFSAPAFTHYSSIAKENITRILPATLTWLNSHFRPNGQAYKNKIDPSIAVMETTEDLIKQQQNINIRNKILENNCNIRDINGKRPENVRFFEYAALKENVALAEKRYNSFVAKQDKDTKKWEHVIYSQQTPSVHTDGDNIRFYNVHHNAGGKAQDIENYAKTKASATLGNFLNPFDVRSGIGNLQRKHTFSIFNHCVKADNLLKDYAIGKTGYLQSCYHLKEHQASGIYGIESARKFMPATLQMQKNLLLNIKKHTFNELARTAKNNNWEPRLATQIEQLKNDISIKKDKKIMNDTKDKAAQEITRASEMINRDNNTNNAKMKL